MTKTNENLGVNPGNDGATDERARGLLAWQWATYSKAHRDRRNLAVHLATVPLFILGTASVPIALVAGTFGFAAVGAALAALAMFLQGRLHQKEAMAPAPFRGPVDVGARIFAEQWVTFPRFVASGAFARAWRTARPSGVA